MSVTSDDVDYLVWRYLVESGYTHSAFTFSNEGSIGKQRYNTDSVSTGALVHLLQRGMQYMELEANLAEDVHNVEAPFLSVPGKDVLMKDAGELKEDLQQRKEEERHNIALRLEQQHKEEKQRAKVQKQRERARRQRGEAALKSNEVMTDRQSFAPSEVQELQGHTGEVLTATWSPDAEHLASSCGGERPQVMLWELPLGSQHAGVMRERLRQPSAQDATQDTLRHCQALHWSPDSAWLAGGIDNGVACLWSRTGGDVECMHAHKGGIAVVRFSLNCQRMLTAGTDSHVVVWDVATRKQLHTFQEHERSTVNDACWRDNDVLAFSSSDHVHVCSFQKRKYLKQFGHSGGETYLGWSQDCLLLATGGDDNLVKVWRADRDQALHTLEGHTREVSCVRWSPSGAGSHQHTLISTSYDNTARVWDADRGVCLQEFTGHSAPVMCVACSPDGLLAASGSDDEHVQVWTVQDGKQLKRYKGRGSCMSISWSSRHDRIAAAFQQWSTLPVLTLKR